MNIWGVCFDEDAALLTVASMRCKHLILFWALIQPIFSFCFAPSQRCMWTCIPPGIESFILDAKCVSFFPSPGLFICYFFCFSMLLNFEGKVKVRPDRWCSKAVVKSSAVFCLFTAWVPSKLDTLRSRLLEGGAPLMASEAAINPSHRYHHTLCPPLLLLDFRLQPTVQS